MLNRREILTGLAASTVVACARREVVRARLDAASFRASRRFAKTAFGDIAYVERGAGPAALFLHGFPLCGYQWRGALDRLSPLRRCIALDFLGMGYTEVARGQDVGPDAQVAMVVALLDRLSLASCDVVANDSGGAIAQLLAARHPGRVRTLLLTNCDTEIESPPRALLPVIELARQGVFADRWLGPWRRDPPMARSSDGIGGMCYAESSHPTDDAIETYFAPLLASDRRKALVDAYAIALERNSLAGIAPLRVPTRIVWGMADTIFSPAGADHLDRVATASRGVRRLERSKLFWPEERPDVIAEEAAVLWAAS